MNLIDMLRRDYARGDLVELRACAEVASVRLSDRDFAEYLGMMRELSARKTIIVNTEAAE